MYSAVRFKTRLVCSRSSWNFVSKYCAISRICFSNHSQATRWTILRRLFWASYVPLYKRPFEWIENAYWWWVFDGSVSRKDCSRGAYGLFLSQANLASVMISVFRQMTEHHFDIYINHFNTRSDLLDFLMEILLVFKDLISRPVYPNDWCEMVLLQNKWVERCYGILSKIRKFKHSLWFVLGLGSWACLLLNVVTRKLLRFLFVSSTLAKIRLKLCMLARFVHVKRAIPYL